MGPPGCAGGSPGASYIQPDRVSGTQESAGTRRHRSPRESHALEPSPLQMQEDSYHLFRGPVPHPGTKVPISPGGGGQPGVGPVTGSAGKCSLLGLSSPRPLTRKWVMGKRLRVRPSALRLTSRILLTGFSVVRSLSGGAAFLPSLFRPPGLWVSAVSCVCLGALPCSGQMGACLCLCAP